MTGRKFLKYAIILVFIIISSYFGFALIYSYLNKEKLYYIPDLDVYIKIVRPPINKYGYIVFSKDSVFSLSEQIDYIKVNKSETAIINIIFDPNDKNELYIDDRFNFSSFNPIKYKMNKINFRDTTFFSKMTIAEINTYLLKCPFTDITVDGYLEYVYIANCGEESPCIIEPIK